MHITCTDYVEIPAPRSIVAAVLAQETAWTALPTGGERLGSMWRWGNELYTVRLDTSGCPEHTPLSESEENKHPDPDGEHEHPPPTTLRWHIVPVSNAGAVARVELELHDATVSTHAVVRVSLARRGSTWPWHQVLEQQRVAGTIRRCTQALRTLLNNDARRVTAEPGDESATDETHQQPTTHATTRAHSLATQLRPRYPTTIAWFETMEMPEHLENVWMLEQSWQRIMNGEYDAALHVEKDEADEQWSADYDLVYAGGGLGLLHAAVMACCYGWRVMVFDRSEVGWAHREWNISRSELQALVDIGLATWDELEPVIMREYRTGLVSFYTGPYGNVAHSDLWMENVLSLAIDANGLLRLMRRKLEAAGGTVLDYRSFRRVLVTRGNPMQVEVELGPSPAAAYAANPSRPQPHDVETYRTRLLLDGMGSTSPLTLLRYRGHPFGGFCPTVGTVVGGFVEGNAPREYDPTVGDILISVADTQHDSQLIWEGFPGRNDEVTVYVFYYVANDFRLAPPGQPCKPALGCRPSYSLFELFEEYFSLLPDYKKPGPNFRHIKPVYGYIPGRHSLRPNDVPMLRGVLPIGDSAAQQSPLTYCGFGSHVRNLHRVTSLLDYALCHNRLEPHQVGAINAFQTNVSLNWVFSRFMQPWGDPHNVNELQNVFLGILNDMGIAAAERFFQDRMHWSDYNKIVLGVLLRYPVIMVQAWRALKLATTYQWIRDYLRFTREAGWAAIARAAGPRAERVLYQLCDRFSPDVGLKVRARYAGWRVMGWVAR